MNRRRWLQLGLGATLILGLVGGGAALLRPGLVGGKLSPEARRLMRDVALAVLDGQWPTASLAREARLDQQLAQLEAHIAGFPVAVRAQLDQVLSLLSSGAGRLALTGLNTDWGQASVAEVQEALDGMRLSGLALRQQIYRALRDLHSLVFFSDASNWAQIAYPGPREMP